MLFRRLTVFVALAALVSLALTGGAMAQASGSADTVVTLEAEDVELNPGDTAELEFALENTGTQPVGVDIDASSLYDVDDTLSVEGFDADGAVWYESDRYWAGQDLELVQLAPGESRSPSITVAAPSDVADQSFDLQVGSPEQNLSATAEIAISDDDAPGDEDDSNEAAPSSPDRDVAETVGFGETTTVTVTAEATDNINTIALNESFAPAAAESVSFEAIRANGEPIKNSTGFTDTVDTSRLTVLYLGGEGEVVASPGDPISVTYTITAPPEGASSAQNITVSGTLGLTNSTGETTNYELGTDTLTVTNRSPAAEYRNPDTGEVEITGVRNAVGDFTSGEADINTLREVIQAFVN